MSYNGWMISDDERERIIALFPPRYPVQKATHVTLAMHVKNEIPVDADIEIIGHIDSHDGVEALVVSVNGSHLRPDGLIFHITLALAAGRASKESNDILASKPFQLIEPPIPITTRAFYSHGDGVYITSPLTRTWDKT